jgi:hypothetical protein
MRPLSQALAAKIIAWVTDWHINDDGKVSSNPDKVANDVAKSYENLIKKIANQIDELYHKTP